MVELSFHRSLVVVSDPAEPVGACAVPLSTMAEHHFPVGRRLLHFQRHGRLRAALLDPNLAPVCGEHHRSAVPTNGPALVKS